MKFLIIIALVAAASASNGIWESDSDRCSHPADFGPCHGFDLRYYYNKAARKCYEFPYGGCGGNENNFESEEECLSVCGNESDRVCGENERYVENAIICRLTCENPYFPSRNCFVVRNPRCECEIGFIWLADGKCIKPHECPNIQDKCSANQHYNDCGTLCPVTCENYKNPPKVCVLKCDPGCECDDGYVKAKDGSCVKPRDCPVNMQGSYPVPGIWESESDRCSQPAETGLCRGFFPRYFFDKASGQCKEFIYGGCGGNDNNFGSEDECQSACGNRAAEVCGENERYNECGTVCPLTCENYANPPKFCVKMCKTGCECEIGFVRRADGKCVKPHQCPNIQAALDRPDCDKKAETGLCDAYIPRYYYYDQEAGQCKKFIYGGCGGNRNNFASEEECYNKCGALRAKTRNACEEDKVVGPCKAAFPRFYFNKKTEQCEPFTYGGCEGNSNNFLSQDDCEDVCIY